MGTRAREKQQGVDGDGRYVCAGAVWQRGNSTSERAGAQSVAVGTSASTKRKHERKRKHGLLLQHLDAASQLVLPVGDYHHQQLLAALVHSRVRRREALQRQSHLAARQSRDGAVPA